MKKLPFLALFVLGLIIFPQGIEAQISVLHDISCTGNVDGELLVVPDFGTPPYTYVWNTVDLTPSISGLVAGNYSVTVTDAFAVSTVYSQILTDPAPIIVTLNGQTNVLCTGTNTGNIDVSSSGGTGILTYLWSNGSISEDLSNILAGSYTLTVTDANFCSTTTSIMITEPSSPVQGTLVSTDVLCNGGNDGTATVISASGGTGVLHYLWSTGENTSQITNLSVGNYSVTITDDNACQFIDDVNITEPAFPVSVTFLLADVTCNGGNDGSVTATGIGVGALSYLWSTGENTPTINNLIADSYFVTVTDGNGCSITDTIIVNQPDPITIVPTIVSSSCDGHNDGAISIIVAGGTVPYVFFWQEINFDSIYVSQNLLNVRGGTYSLMLTDSNGCVYLDTLFIPNNYVVPVNIITEPYVCNGSTGSVSITALGAGIGVYYEYAWSSAYTNGSFTTNDTVFTHSPSFAAGPYSLTVTAPGGCALYFDSLVRQSNAPLVIHQTMTHNICYGDHVGSIHLSPSGGDPKPGYHVTWTGPNAFSSTAFSINGLIGGDYVYVVTDDSVCSISETIRIEEPYEAIKFFPTVTNTSCQQSEDGEVVLYVGDIYWSPFINIFSLYDSLGGLIADVPSGQVIGGLPPGLYYTTLTNEYGCTSSDFLFVEKGVEDCILIPNLVTINGDGYNDVFRVQGACEYENFFVQIFTNWGIQVFQSSDCNFVWDPRDNKATPNSVYYYYISVIENGKVWEFKSSINIQK